MKMNNKNGRDRISELPESVLHLILSYLDLKFAIQTSILSTKWRYVWRSLPLLDFDCNEFHWGPERYDFGFGDFVDNVLTLRDSSSCIQSFHLSCYHSFNWNDLYDFDARLSAWIITALEGNVEDLYINLNEQEIELPQRLFSCNSLRKLVLSLFGQKLINLPDSMDLPGLKTLVLDSIEFEGNDDIPSKIISSCPVLESLVFEGCRFYQPIVDIYAPQLKHFVIQHCDEYDYHNKVDLNKYIVKLNAPNLVSFRCHDEMFKDYCLVNVSALVKAEIYMDALVYDENGNSNLDDEIIEVFVQRMFKILRTLQHVETLTLSSWFIEVVSGAPDLLNSPSIQFCNLRCLTLETWLSRDCINAIRHLLKISPNIESLFVQVNEVRFELAKTEGDWAVGTLHHLKFVKILRAQGHLNELHFLEILLKNGVVLEKLIIEPSPSIEGARPSREFVQRLLTLPRASSSIVFSLP